MTGCRTCGGFDGHHDPVAHDFVDAMQREYDEQQTVYEAHEWTGGDEDHCARCDVTWEDADQGCAS